jgi:hypothetical protein
VRLSLPLPSSSLYISSSKRVRSSLDKREASLFKKNKERLIFLLKRDREIDGEKGTEPLADLILFFLV